MSSETKILTIISLAQPEVHLPAEPETEMDIEALQAQYDMGECGEVQNDSDESAEDDPDLNEDEPPEAPSTQSSLRGLTGQQSHSQQGNHNFPSHHIRLVICYDLYIIAHSQIMN